MIRDTNTFDTVQVAINPTLKGVYHVLSIVIDKQHHDIQLHRAQAFITGCPNHTGLAPEAILTDPRVVANHGKNGHSDNSAENLDWVLHVDNVGALTIGQDHAFCAAVQAKDKKVYAGRQSLRWVVLKVLLRRSLGTIKALLRY